ncbi:MAG: ABC transporter ATP-binding protein [Mangrovicoccus sp.]
MLLQAQDLRKSFGGIAVLDGVSLELGAGESLALTGESGSGKSTLMAILGALEPVDSGEVQLAGQSYTGLSEAGLAQLRRHKIGLVFQQFNLIPSLTAGQNLSFQARLAGLSDPAWWDELAQHLGLADHLGKYPEQLSGGQQQRVAIGRALACRPPLVLADEPTGNLDEATGDAVMDLMLGLVGDLGLSLIMVTHSQRLAGRLQHRLHLSAGQLRPC